MKRQGKTIDPRKARTSPDFFILPSIFSSKRQRRDILRARSPLKKMTGHPAKGMHLSAGFGTHLAQGGDEPLPVLVIQKNQLPPFSLLYKSADCIARTRQQKKL